MKAETTLENWNGSTVMEMLLFTPLALLFLFAVIDGGMTLREKCILTDAVRSGISSQIISTDLYEVSAESHLADSEIPPESIQKLVSGVAEEVGRNILRSRGQDDSHASDFRIRAELVELELDPVEGGILSHRLLHPSATYPLQAALDVESVSSEVPHRTCEASIDDALRNPSRNGPSVYAVPLGRAIYGGASADGVIRYLPRALLLCVEATSLPKTVSRGITRSILGRYYTVDELQLVPLRVQLS